MAKKQLEDRWVSILWAGRLIPWKHPEAAIYLADTLKEQGYQFRLSLIGSGVMESQLRAIIQEKGLEDRVALLGALSPEQVRCHMEQAEIYLFTSDFHEGWGKRPTGRCWRNGTRRLPRTGSHEIGTSHRRAGEGRNCTQKVGNGVWIGVGSTLVGDLVIGDGSIVAACACVVKDVPADTLVGSVPARTIRRLDK